MLKRKIVIAGCGIIGATVAYELSLLPQLEITVLEKNIPASGATGAALGLLMGVISGKTKNRAWNLRENSLKRYPSLISELQAQTGLEIPVNHDGLVKLLFWGEKLEKWQKLQQTRIQQGWDLELWTPEQLQQKCPKINLENVVSAVYSPQDTQIQPQLLTQALVKAASLNGVTFEFGREVQALAASEISSELISSEKTKLKQVTTNKGIVEFDYLIVTAGLGSTLLTSGLRESLDIRPVLGQATKLQLPDELGTTKFNPVITGNDIHLVPLGNKQYWLGATVEFPDEAGLVNADATLWQTVKQKVLAFCPAIAEGQILEHWSGKRPRPYGQPAPIIGKLAGYEDVVLATAHYRNGVLLAPGTAQEVIKILQQEIELLPETE